jgi:RNA polymerase sigma-70 factor (ECF subfamily)
MGVRSLATDFELLDRWAEGSAEAGNELFERYFDQVYRFFSHKADAEAPDLVQRTFLACLEGRASFRRGSSYRTYLYAIARNVLYEFIREKTKRTEDVGGSMLRDLAPSPTTLLSRRADERLLLEALRSIPLDLQIALELYYWEQLKAAELAEVLAIPEGTVRSRLRRGLEALEEKLREIEASPDRLASTLASLEGWAAALRNAVFERSDLDST